MILDSIYFGNNICDLSPHRKEKVCKGGAASDEPLRLSRKKNNTLSRNGS